MPQTPRKRLRTGPAVVALAATAAVVGAAVTAAPRPLPPPLTTQPNVLLVVLDTARADRCSVNGYDRPTTPNLERLAREGTNFRTCWSPSPWTAPAHGSLFTGLRPLRHGLVGGRESFALSRSHETLAERLRSAGYATGCWSSNDFVAPSFGLAQGFDTFWACWQQPELTFPIAARSHRLAAEWALARHREGKPFFAFVNDIEPHNPYEPQEPHRTALLGDRFTPLEVADGEGFRFPQTIGYTLGAVAVPPRVLEAAGALYDGELATVDATLEPLFEALRNAGILDETIVIVVSDHGENLGEHGMAEHVFSMHKTLLHVPLVIRYPSAFAAGRQVEDLVRLEDLFPTILELCGLDVPGDIDGRSLLRDLPRRVALGEYERQPNALQKAANLFPSVDLTRYRQSMRSVFDGRWHLIQHEDGRRELYDVDADPLELANLAPARPETVERLAAFLRD